MSKLKWDVTGEKTYETGVQNGVLYVKNAGAYPAGVVWNGLISVAEKPTGAEPNPKYADNQKYFNMMSLEEFEATIEAYTYPVEFEPCDGSGNPALGIQIGQQSRSPFGLCYKTTLGNDEDGNEYGYKLHLIYGCLAAPSEKSYETINDTPDAITFSWAITTTPVTVDGFRPTASLVIDSTKIDAAKLAELEAILFGVDAVVASIDPVVAAVTAVIPSLPLPDAIIAIVGPIAQG